MDDTWLELGAKFVAETIVYVSAVAAGSVIFRQCALNGLEGKLDQINTTLESTKSQPKLYEQNVFGGEESEQFYVVDEKRVYLSIDGFPIEDVYKPTVLLLPEPSNQ